VIYWDTSGLLKLYVNEADSAYFVGMVAASSQPLLACELARVELFSALSRKELAAELPPGERDRIFANFQDHIDRGRLLILPVGRDVFQEAIRLTRLGHGQQPPVLVRSLDAIHIAAALMAGATTMVATDHRLRDLATCAGLRLRP
jgi:predicted nucleic acid-binding protein